MNDWLGQLTMVKLEDTQCVWVTSLKFDKFCVEGEFSVGQQKHNELLTLLQDVLYSKHTLNLRKEPFEHKRCLNTIYRRPLLTLRASLVIPAG